MKNKMRLLVGLLVLGVILIGGSVWLLIAPEKQNEALEIMLTPAPDSYLTNPLNEFSGILLNDIQIEINTSDKRYSTPSSTSNTVEEGEQILLIHGTILNDHPENEYIAMWADGYDSSGKQVAWTLNAAHIVGQFGTQLDKGETGEFALHLNFSKNIKSIYIYGANYLTQPP